MAIRMSLIWIPNVHFCINWDIYYSDCSRTTVSSQFMEDHNIPCHRGGIWTLIYSLEPTNWRTAIMHVYICVRRFLFDLTVIVATVDSLLALSVCVLQSLPLNSGCVYIFVFGDYQSGQRLLGVWVQESGLGWKKRKFARHLFSFTCDLKYLLAAAGEQQRKHLCPSWYLVVFHQHMEKLLSLLF